MNPADVLKTEYSEEFDQLSKNRVSVSFHKYGPISKNFGAKLVDAVGLLNLDTTLKYGCVEKCIKKYIETGNTEYLVDAKNYLMFEFMFPQHPSAHFRATDSKDSAGIVGISINEIKAFSECD